MLYVTWHCFCNEVILRDFGCCAGSLIDNSNNIPLYVSYELCETFAGVLNQPNALQMNIDTASLYWHMSCARRLPFFRKNYFRLS